MKAAAEAGDRASRADSRTPPNLVLGASLQQPLREVGALTQLRVAVGSYGRYEQRKKATGGGPVVSSKTMLAVGLAAATLVVFVVVIAMGGALRAGLAPWPGIGVAILAIAAFAVSRERRSFVVAGLLAASGLVGVVYALIRTDFLMASSFPGPIFGIILGLPILGLAVAEAVGATRDRRSY
jgi:hypothetical protein